MNWRSIIIAAAPAHTTYIYDANWILIVRPHASAITDIKPPPKPVALEYGVLILILILNSHIFLASWRIGGMGHLPFPRIHGR